MIRALAFVIVALLLPMQVSAADIQVVDIRAEGWTLGIFGEIVEGDADKARALVGNRVLKAVALGSPGGDLDEALKLITLVKSHAEMPLHSMYVLSECSSACGFIALLIPVQLIMFAANARIGLHQVHTERGPDLKSTAEMGELMRQRGLPEAWIGAMERTSPRRMTFLTPDDILVGTDSAVLTFARLSIATYFGM
jgi:hypothetical protein